MLLFAANKTFAQQSKDAMPDYMNQFRYYQLPGMPDSATFFKQLDSLRQRKILMDSLQKRYDSMRIKQSITLTQNHLALNKRKN